jgi:hypothetical protein
MCRSRSHVELGGGRLMRVICQPVDPRDTRWEDDYPTYRVYFWRRDDARSDEWRVTDSVNVRDVLEWADGRVQPGWTYQVFVAVNASRGLGTIRLLGRDPSTQDRPPR